jgi:CysZ protein
MAIANRPKLRLYFWLPAAIGATISAILFYLLGAQIIAAATPNLPQWLSFLEWFIVPILFVLLILATAWSVSFFTIIIASPLLSNLAGAVENELDLEMPATDQRTQRLHGGDLWSGKIGQLLLQAPRDIGREVSKLRYHLPRAAGLVIFSFIPILNFMSPFLCAAYGAWFMAVQFSDYAADNHGANFADSLQMLKRNWWSSIGFGAVTTLALAIPFLNLFMLPAAVAGGTLLWRHNLKFEPDKASSSTR